MYDANAPPRLTETREQIQKGNKNDEYYRSKNNK